MMVSQTAVSEKLQRKIYVLNLDFQKINEHFLSLFTSIFDKYARVG